MELGLKQARLVSAFFSGIFVCCFLFFSRVQAQVSQNFYSASTQVNSLDNAFLSARATAMGSAFTGVADDASALFANPAGLAWLTKGEISLNSHLGLVDTLQETLVLALPTVYWGSFGLAGSYLDYGTMEGRDSLGSLAPNYSANRLGLQVGWAIKILEPLSLGAAFLYSQQSVMGTGSSSLVPEVGLLLLPLKDLKLGLDYENGGWNSATGTLDSFLKIGTSFCFRLDPSFRLLAALGDSIELNDLNYAQAGLEACWRSQYFLRAGYQSTFAPNGYGGFSGFSFGGGLVIAGFTLDYAYLPYGDLGATHRFSVTYAFETLARAPVTISSQEGPGLKAPLIGTEEGRGSLSGKLSAPASLSLPAKGLVSKTGSENPREKSVGAAEAASLPLSNPSGNPIEGAGLPISISNSLNMVTNQPKPDAEGTTKDSLNMTFDIPPDYLTKGDNLEAQGRHSEAVLAYQKAIRQDSQNVQAWSKLANLYAHLGRRDYAIPCFEQVLLLRPDNGPLRVWLDKYKGQKP